MGFLSQTFCVQWDTFSNGKVLRGMGITGMEIGITMGYDSRRAGSPKKDAFFSAEIGTLSLLRRFFLLFILDEQIGT
jgi:hypothetical protein